MFETAMTAFMPTLLENVSDTVGALLPEPAEPEAESGDPVAERLAMLEKQLAEREVSDRRNALANHLDTVLSGYDLIDRQAVKELLLARSAEATEKKGKWLMPGGHTLEDTVKAFIATPFGQHQLKPVSGGAGTPETKPEPRSETLEDVVASAFL